MVRSREASRCEVCQTRSSFPLFLFLHGSRWIGLMPRFPGFSFSISLLGLCFVHRTVAFEAFFLKLSPTTMIVSAVQDWLMPVLFFCIGLT